MKKSKKKSQTVSSHTQYRNGKKVHVRSYTRDAHWMRAKSTWIAAGCSALVMTGILVEAGITLVSTVLLVIIAALGAVAVIAGRWIEENRKEMNHEHARRMKQAGRTTRTSRARASGGRSGTSSRGRTGSGRTGSGRSGGRTRR